MEYDVSALKRLFFFVVADIGVGDIRRASDDRAGCAIRPLMKTQSQVVKDKR